MQHSILVVDDNVDILNIISLLLNEDNYILLNASSVAEAIEIIQTLEVDLLIVDYYLADKTGIELIEIVRSEKQNVPIIMISVGEENKIKSLSVGANVFLLKPFHGEELKIIVSNIIKLVETYKKLETASDMIEALSRAVEARDTYTQGHHDRVAKYSLMIYDKIYKNNPREREALRIGCLLHDIGKIGIPDNILKSKLTLSSKERKIVEKHAVYGFDICKDLKTLKDALPVIKNHHEKFDGSGYPDNLGEDEIPDIVAIAAIADIYDALTSNRSYHKGKTPKEAFHIMETENNGRTETLSKKFLSVFKDIILGESK